MAGQRRTVAAIDPTTGETVWTYREPNTERWERSMRQNYGKGVAYGEVDGRGVIFYVTPAFFLHALDAKTGEHIQNFGSRVPIEGFPSTGVVDLLVPLIADWGPWLAYSGTYDPDHGIPRELGYITSSSPPIVVNGVVVVGNSAEQGYLQTRIENVPGDILAFDARSGAFKWKFHVIPRPGEVGHETWLNDAWQWTGDISSWAPMSADENLGLVYFPTNPPTIDYFGGFRHPLRDERGRPGRSTSACGTSRRSTTTSGTNVPILVDLEVDGRAIPALIQTSDRIIYTFNRETGEPIWPIEEVPVFQTEVPGNWTSPTQPLPTRPEPSEPLGLDEDDLIDWTPELRQEARDLIRNYRIGGPFMPRLFEGHDAGVIDNIRCAGGLNITNPATLDPTTGILYVPSSKRCGGGLVASGADADEPDNPQTTGTTISQWVAGPGGGLPRVQGLPVWKPPYNRVSAYDMNTGERIYWIPIGEPSEEMRNNPALRGMDLSNFGGGGNSIQMVSGDLLYATEGSSGPPVLNAYNKLTGDHVGEILLPSPGQYGMMSFLHHDFQHIVVQVGQPGRLVALRLPGMDIGPVH